MEVTMRTMLGVFAEFETNRGGHRRRALTCRCPRQTLVVLDAPGGPSNIT
jgi:hypothetical protein